MPNDNHPQPKEAAAPIGEGSIFAKLAKIESILDGSTKVEQKKILEMLSATRSLRVISADRPIVSTAVAPPNRSLGGKAKKGAPSKATWKNDPAWIAIQADHAAAVAAVKDALPAGKDESVARLREVELKIRAVKQKLNGGPKNC